MMDKKIDNTLMRVYLDTIQYILGLNGLKSILNYAHLEKYIDNFPPDNDKIEVPRDDLRQLYLALREMFGQKGTRGLQLRVGRELTNTFLEKRPAVKSMKLAARLLPEMKRMRLSLERFIEESVKRLPSSGDTPQFELHEEEDYFLFIDRDSYTSEGITSDRPICDIYVGNLESSLEWITGHHHKIEEIECRAMGHSADVFKIWKKRDEKN